MAVAGLVDGLPQPLRRLAWPLAALLLTAVFFVIGFPYDALARRIESELATRAGLLVRIGELSPGLGLTGPYVGARDVVGSRPGGRSIAIDELRLRPAWSLSWLMLDPAVHIHIDSAIGNVDGAVTLRRPGFQGRLENVELGSLPIGAALAGVDLKGRADADIDLRPGPDDAGGGLDGSVRFLARDGSLALDRMPIAVPYTKLEGSMRFGGDAWATVEAFTLDSPLATATASGTIRHGPDGRQPLDLSLRYEVADASLSAALRGYGVTVSPTGQAQLQIAGTLASPTFQ